MASLTSQLIVSLVDNVSDGARRIGSSLTGISRTIQQTNAQQLSLSERVDAAITRNNRALESARGRMAESIGTFYALRAAISAPIESAKAAGITSIDVDPELASIRRSYVDMRDESFVHLGERLAREIGGNFRIHPKDPGGATNRGVTLATFRRHVKPKGTKADLRAITDGEVATVYYKHYWAAVHGNELPAGVDYAVFDLAVNSGPSRAARFLQQVVGVAEDGRIGPVTLAAVRTADPVDVVARLCVARLAWLKTLKTWPTFGKGWERRVTEVRHDAILDAADEASDKVVVEDAATVTTDNAPVTTPTPQTPTTSQIGILAAAIIGAIIMALSQLWNWITGG